MFQDENTPLVHETASENQFRQSFDPLHVVRRVGEDDVETVASRHTLEVDEDMGPDALNLVESQFFRRFSDEPLVDRVQLHRHHTDSPARSERTHSVAATRIACSMAPVS